MIELAVPVIAYGCAVRRIRDRQEAVVVGGAADEHADGLTAQTRRRDARMLERLPGELERHPLLRVDVVGFHLRQREELGVETLDIAQVAATGAGRGDPRGDARFIEELRPAALRQIGDGVAALEQRLPHLVGGVHIPGVAGTQADDRDVVDVGGARPVLRGRVVDFLGLALDDHLSERLDGGVPEGDGGRQRGAGEVLDVRGHRDGIARRQAEFDHGRGLVDGVR